MSEACVTRVSRRDTAVSHGHVTPVSRYWRHMQSRSHSFFFGYFFLLLTDIRAERAMKEKR